MNKPCQTFHHLDARLNVEPNFLQSQIGFHKLGVQLSNQQQMFLHDYSDGGAESVRHLAKLKLAVQVHKFLN